MIRVKFHMPEIEQVDTRAEFFNRLSPRLLLGAGIVAVLTIGLVGLAAWLMRPMGEVTSLDLHPEALEPQVHPVAPTETTK